MTPIAMSLEEVRATDCAVGGAHRSCWHEFSTTGSNSQFLEAENSAWQRASVAHGADGQAFELIFLGDDVSEKEMEQLSSRVPVDGQTYNLAEFRSKTMTPQPSSRMPETSGMRPVGAWKRTEEYPE
jgi:hypothetical protein